MRESSNVSTAAIHPSVNCRQYLVTYSQADESRKFLENDRRACSREEHQNHGFHYYQALKLTGFKKWLSVENKMVENQGVQVSFSSKHNFCLSTYRYVCKSDQNVAHSENHPPGLLQLLLQKPKSQLQYFVLSLPQIGSPQKENVLVVL